MNQNVVLNHLQVIHVIKDKNLGEVYDLIQDLIDYLNNKTKRKFKK